MTKQLARKNAVARAYLTLSPVGGCFQNHILFAEVVRRLNSDFKVLTHAEVRPMTAVLRSDKPR